MNSKHKEQENAGLLARTTRIFKNSVVYGPNMINRSHLNHEEREQMMSPLEIT